MMRKNIIPLFTVLLALVVCASCNKLVKVPEPISSVTTTEVFSNQGNAISAVTGIYSNMSYDVDNLIYSNGGVTQLCGMSSDELELYNASGETYEFQTNQLLSNNENIINILWAPIYSNIYQANAIIEGLAASTAIPSSVKAQLTAEAEFIRAFCYFYLVNLYGDVPLITSTDWTQHQGQARAPSTQIYAQIESDLLDAQIQLPGDYSLSGGNRFWANSFAATALLARVYVFEKKWNSADSASSVVINSGDFSLLSNLNNVFLVNSNEAILQLQVVDNFPWATQEGYQFVPYDTTSSPNFYITPSLLSAFEPGDTRRYNWIDSTDVSGVYYYFPNKYKSREGSSGNIGESYMLLRLSEQYLLRAEARANENTNLATAISDLNIVRERASLTDLPPTLSQAQVLAAVQQERRVELCAEWGNRWLDLKRWGIATQVLSANKGFSVVADALLYPIPLADIQTDPSLTQNTGY
ncbi:MAG: RagB/SusD family nutrient uptake outer membrane protein [Puia sp.]|nr:RagB/SusD family nutrient uptake outer membrane protein [Puia sp.]